MVLLCDHLREHRGGDSNTLALCTALATTPPMAVVDEPSPLLGQQRHQPRRRCCAVHSRRSGAWCTHAGNHKISACHANNQHGQAPTIPSPGLRSPCHSRARAGYTVRVQRPAATQLHPHRTWTRRSRCPGSTTLNEPGTTHAATNQHAPSGRALVARCTCGAKRVKNTPRKATWWCATPRTI